jgi:hypothetical protein
LGQYLTRRANQRHSFIIAQCVKRPWARNGALFGVILVENPYPTIEVALAREVAMARRSEDADLGEGGGCSPSLRANESHECMPDRLREAIHASPSLRAQRSNPSRRAKKDWIASSLRSSQ